MSGIPSILCPVDLSSHSLNVVQNAGAIAEHFAARLIVVNVGVLPSHDDDLRALIREALPGAAAARIEPRLILTDAHPAATIVRLAHTERVDLIVMGSHGLGGVRQYVFGSTTRDVLRDTAIPTLVVPRLGPHLSTVRELPELGSVLAPTDFSELSRRDVRIAAGIAGAIGVRLLLTHVLPPAAGPWETAARWHARRERARMELEQLRHEHNAEATIQLLLESGQPAEVVARIAEERHAGLIVLGLRGASGAHGPRPGSIAYRVLCTASTLLLALPPILSGMTTPAARVGAAV